MYFDSKVQEMQRVFKPHSLLALLSLFFRNHFLNIFMALNDIMCAGVPLRNYSLTYVKIQPTITLFSEELLFNRMSSML